jgi:hypothetical protein
MMNNYSWADEMIGAFSVSIDGMKLSYGCHLFAIGSWANLQVLDMQHTEHNIFHIKKVLY